MQGHMLDLQILRATSGKKELHRTHQNSNLVEGSFSNEGNLRAPIQFVKERQP